MEYKTKFVKVNLNSQDLGSDNDHMISGIVFSLERDGDVYGPFEAAFKQAVGADFEDLGSLEVHIPEETPDDVNGHELQKACEQYFKRCVGSGGRGIRIGGSAQVKMRNSVISISWETLVPSTD